MLFSRTDRSRPTLRAVAIRVGEPAVEGVADILSMDTADRTSYVLEADPHKLQRKYRQGLIRTFTIREQDPFGLELAAGSAIMHITDESKIRTVAIDVDASAVRGSHGALVRALIRRAQMAQPDRITVTASANATKLAAIEEGLAVEDSLEFVTEMIRNIGVHVGDVMNFRQLMNDDPFAATAYWKEGTQAVVSQVNAVIGGSETAPWRLDEQAGVARATDIAIGGFARRRLAEMPLKTLLSVRIAGGVHCARLPVPTMTHTDIATDADDYLVVREISTLVLSLNTPETVAQIGESAQNSRKVTAPTPKVGKGT